jgi:hypothetical protein
VNPFGKMYSSLGKSLPRKKDVMGLICVIGGAMEVIQSIGGAVGDVEKRRICDVAILRVV